MDKAAKIFWPLIQVFALSSIPKLILMSIKFEFYAYKWGDMQKTTLGDLGWFIIEKVMIFFFFMDVNHVVCEEILNAIVWDNDLSTHSKELDLNQQR